MKIRVSLFDSVQAKSVEVRWLTPCEIVELIDNTKAAEKTHLPLLKLGFFGDHRTQKGSLRHDRNLHFISGVELDYDGEQMSFDAAVATAEKLPLLAIIYTSPSHTPGRPRWRLLALTSLEYPAKDRTRFVERINGAYRGIFSSESFIASQSFYFGHLIGDPNFQIELIEGEPVDRLDALDLIARGKARIGAGGNGHAFEGSTAGLIEAQLEELIRSGAHYHEPTLRLATLAARRGDDQGEVEDRILDLFDAVPPELQNRERWARRRAEVHRCVADMYFGVEREQGEAAEREAAGLADLEARSGVTPASDRIEPEPAEPQPEPPRGNVHNPEAETGSADRIVGGPPDYDNGGGGGGDATGGQEGGEGGGGNGGGGTGGEGEDDTGENDDGGGGDGTEDGAITEAELKLRRAAIKRRNERLLAWLNHAYAVVNEAGKVVVVRWQREPVLNREVLDRMTFSDFKRYYLNRSLSTITKKDGNEQISRHNLAEWWLRHPDRTTYNGITFDPTGRSPPSYLNLWRGFGVAPTPGDWSRMHDHIGSVLCGGVTEQADYFFNWLAQMVQLPHLAGEVAIVLRSDEEGTGKGILGRWLVVMMGRHGLQIAHAGQLTGRFNEHLRDLVFLFPDEAFFAGDETHEGVLKSLITEYSTTIEGKYRAVISVKNMLHILMASNRDWVVPAKLTARRFYLPDVVDSQRNNLEYFAALDRQMRQGGCAAMLHDLLHRDISAFDVRHPPNTSSLTHQKLLSLSSLEKWWVAVLERGFVYESRHGAPHFRAWHEFVATELLWNSYQQWCGRARSTDRQPREALKSFMAKFSERERPRGDHAVREIDVIHAAEFDPITGLPVNLDRVAVHWQERPRGYRIGDLDTARDRFAATHSEIFEGDHTWPDQI